MLTHLTKNKTADSEFARSLFAASHFAASGEADRELTGDGDNVIKTAGGSQRAPVRGWMKDNATTPFPRPDLASAHPSAVEGAEPIYRARRRCKPAARKSEVIGAAPSAADAGRRASAPSQGQESKKMTLSPSPVIPRHPPSSAQLKSPLPAQRRAGSGLENASVNSQPLTNRPASKP